MQGISSDSNAAYDGLPLDPPPSTRQGFGRVHLTRSLPLAAYPSTGWRLQARPTWARPLHRTYKHRSDVQAPPCTNAVCIPIWSIMLSTHHR